MMVADGDERRSLSIDEAVEMFLDDRRTDGATDHTLESYELRLRQFREWCEEEQIDEMAELDGWSLEQFKRARAADGLAASSLKGQMMAVLQLVKFCARIEVVTNDLVDRVPIPTVSKQEESDDTRLTTEEATRLLEAARDDMGRFGTPQHTILEVLWHTGARLGGVRGLDLSDFSADEGYLRFRHRESTPLKNGLDGERYVVIGEPVIEALETYVARERYDKRDEEGREPLFAARQGRPSATTLRAYCYQSTQPCTYGPCPHGVDDPRTCDYRQRNHSSKCPSSRSPHQVRTGSITWQINRGLPLEVVSERVNASPSVIERFYDKATEREKMKERRHSYTSGLDISEESDDE